MSVYKAFIYLIIIVCMGWAYYQGGIFGCIGIGAVGFVVFDFLLKINLGYL